MTFKARMGRKIRAELVLQGKNPKQLAEWLGCTPSNIYHYLDGSQSLSFEQAIAVTQFLGKPITWLFEGEDLEEILKQLRKKERKAMGEAIFQLKTQGAQSKNEDKDIGDKS